MKKIKKIKIKSYTNSSGRLMPLTFNKKFPIKTKRIFFINGKKNQTRGEHAHKKCSQLFVPISGKFFLNIKTPDSKKKILLNYKNKTAILVPPKYWCGIKFLTKDSVIMVVCDKEYDFNDYLEDFDEYKAYLKKI
jgi:dTDP-4-dehydrorhamnose 3,5-epimerase-like enzyme|tara:strand:+ start:190 stop:594 length:405 start_codon:yes stop_codon:yes gene_type:complete